MRLSRYFLSLVAVTAISGTSALAAPPISVGSHGSIGIAGPPIGVPPAHVPPIGVPPVNAPKPQGNSVPAVHGNVNGAARANANAAIVAGVMHGTVTAVSGNTVTVQWSNGSTQTYTVSEQTAARLQSYVNKMVAFRVQNGTLNLVGRGTPPLHGMLLSVAGTSAQVRLANGTTQTYTVNTQQAAWLQTHVGKRVAFWVGANGTVELDQRSHASNVARQSKTKKPKPHRGHVH